MKNIYHIKLGERRTTVSLDNTLSVLLALKLGAKPNSPEAHMAIRSQLQTWINANDDPGRIRVSQWLTGEAILFIADKMLSSRYKEWILCD